MNDALRAEIDSWMAERQPVYAPYVNEEPLMKDQEFKADGGKLEPSLLFAGMPRALYAVIAVLQYGKQKYEAHSWKRVEGNRYDDARLRHVLDHYMEDADKESGLYHMAHEATNCLFQLEKKLEALGADWKKALEFKAPPTDHKKTPEEVVGKEINDAFKSIQSPSCSMRGGNCDCHTGELCALGPSGRL